VVIKAVRATPWRLRSQVDGRVDVAGRSHNPSVVGSNPSRPTTSENVSTGSRTNPRHVRTGIAVGFCPCGALGPPNHARARLQSMGRAAVISAVHHRGRDVIEAQAGVCELRQAHPRWGARRLEFETHQISGQI
jgi:hypothetical protein